GKQPGGQISISSRSGTNQYHGSLFEYFRNEKLDANNWISNSKALPKAALRQNDFGGVFSGPVAFPWVGEGTPAIWKGSKTFFFFSYEGLRLRLPQAKVFTVFTQSFRNTANAQVLPILLAIPLPNGAAINANTAQFIASWSDPQTTDAYSFKVDQIFKNITFFGRYSDTPSSGSTRQLTPASLSLSKLRSQALTFGSTWLISNNWTNDFRFNYTKSLGTGENVLDTFGGAAPYNKSLFLPSFINGGASVVSPSITGFTTSGVPLGRFASNNNRQINVVDDVSYIKGNHHLEFGMDYRYLFPHTEPIPYNLSVVVTNATTGLARYTVASADPATIVFPTFSAYGQDTWKLSKKLSLNFGIRWELVPPPYATEGAQPLTFNSLDDPTKLSFAPLGTKVWKTT
ncbi:MAG TPA: TonB-dependent receptor, partial [Pyrinomonadaceae bacterium]|nr:TonB-dependent receptor [Pyrinomonadaceae bacterium]